MTRTATGSDKVFDVPEMKLQPLHNGGITVSRANGACTRVDLNVYRGATI